MFIAKMKSYQRLVIYYQRYFSKVSAIRFAKISPTYNTQLVRRYLRKQVLIGTYVSSNKQNQETDGQNFKIKHTAKTERIIILAYSFINIFRHFYFVFNTLSRPEKAECTNFSVLMNTVAKSVLIITDKHFLFCPTKSKTIQVLVLSVFGSGQWVCIYLDIN